MTREGVTLPKTLPARETSFFAGSFGTKILSAAEMLALFL